MADQRSGEHFPEWPLHDAVMERLGLDGQSRTCWLDVLAFFEPGSDARAARIEWWGVRAT